MAAGHGGIGRRPDEEEPFPYARRSGAVCALSADERTHLSRRAADTPDPFVQLAAKGHRFQTPPAKRSLSPVWNSAHILRISSRGQLCAQVYDARQHGPEERDGMLVYSRGFLGLAVIPMDAVTELDLNIGGRISFRLSKREPADVVSGRIVLFFRHAAFPLEPPPSSSHVGYTGDSDADAASQSGHGGSGDRAAGAVAASSDAALVPGGDRSGRGVATSDLGRGPGNDAVQEGDALAWARTDTGPVVVPIGWTVEVDPNGTVFYVNAMTRAVKWMPPIDSLRRRAETQIHNPRTLYRVAAEARLDAALACVLPGRPRPPVCRLESSHDNDGGGGARGGEGGGAASGYRVVVTWSVPDPRGRDPRPIYTLYLNRVREDGGSSPVGAADAAAAAAGDAAVGADEDAQRAASAIAPGPDPEESAVELEHQLIAIYSGYERTHSASGLIAGRTYTFAVRASNAYGRGPISRPSEPVHVPIASTPIDIGHGGHRAAEEDTRPHCPYFMSGFCHYGNQCRFSHGSGYASRHRICVSPLPPVVTPDGAHCCGDTRLQTPEDWAAAMIAVSLNQDANASMEVAIAASLASSSQSMPVDVSHMSELDRRFHVKQERLRNLMPVQRGECHFTVARDNLYESSFAEVMSRPAKELKKHLFVHFKGEGGLDYGGLAREWIYLLSHELFDLASGLFERSRNDAYTLQISPASSLLPNYEESFKFTGRIIGLAVFHRHLIDAVFVRPFYKQLLGQPVALLDMQSVDPDIHRSLLWILENDITGVLDLTFIAEYEQMGQTKVDELIPNGAMIQVTEKNKVEFVERMIHWRAARGTERQMRAFMAGFHEFLPLELLRPLDASELEFLLSGLAHYDVDDWRAHTLYKGYSETDEVPRWFWRAVEEFNEEQRGRLLQFVTGSARVPVEGFQTLQGKSCARAQRHCTPHRGSSA